MTGSLRKSNTATKQSLNRIAVVYHASDRVASRVGFARFEHLQRILQPMSEITGIVLCSKKESRLIANLTTVSTRVVHDLFETLSSRNPGVFPKGLFSVALTLNPFHFRTLIPILSKSKVRCCIASGIYISLPVLLLSRTRGPVIFDDHNFEMRLALKQFSKSVGPLAKIMSLGWLWYVSIVELLSAHLADMISIPTSSEREDMCRVFRIPESRVVVLPNPLPGSPSYPDGGSPSMEMGETRGEVLFIGDMTYGPNREAANWILKVLAPALESLNTHARVIIAGKGSISLPSAITDNVKILGFVPDISSVINNATVCISPIAYAGGTQNKVIQYMSLGKPVVATREAARGLEKCTGIMVVERNRFAETIEWLLRNRSYMEYLASTNYEHFQEMQRVAPAAITDFRSAVSALLP